MNKPIEPKEVLARIFQQVELDTINQEVDAMSDDEIEKELAADGYTRDKINEAFAPQQALLGEIVAGERRQRRNHALSYVGGVATAAAVVLVARSGDKPTSEGTKAPLASTAAAGAPDLRKEAFEACGRGHWADCARLLDQAKALDPAGESDPDVQSARSQLPKR